MLRGPLHDRGADGRCTECGEPFPCPAGVAIFESVVGENTTEAPRPADLLLRAATYLKWWRDGAIADADLPEDLAEIIVALEQLAAELQRQRESPDR